MLATENVPGQAVEALRQRGHDIVWMRTEAPGSSDPDVLERAQAEGRVIVTFDKDFGELAFHQRLPASSGIILFRIRPSSPDYVTALAIAALETEMEWVGHFSVVEEDPIRITPLPVQR